MPGFTGTNCKQSMLNHSPFHYLYCSRTGLLGGGGAKKGSVGCSVHKISLKNFDNDEKACMCFSNPCVNLPSLTDINECASNPCQNGAACVDQVNGYACTCRAPFSGTSCDVGTLILLFLVRFHQIKGRQP